MKIVFLTNQIMGSGGIERVLSQRTNYLVEKFGYDITIITTENNSKNYSNTYSFFQYNKKIKNIDLNICYLDFYSKNRNVSFFKRKILEKQLKNKNLKMLKKLISEIEPDIIVSVNGISRCICSKLNRKYKKVLEHHSEKGQFILKRKKGFFEMIKNSLHNIKEYLYIYNYDEFLVLTEEDKKSWGNKKIKVINNPLPFIATRNSLCINKKIISVGRLEAQKGFDILIDVWKKVNKVYPEWILEIYGEGSQKKELQNKIDNLNLTDSLLLMGNEKNIQEKYLESSIYVMSSRYEGMPMVLLETMNCGLPIISFECPCGPKDLIKDGENGYLCKCFNVNEMAEKIIYLIKNKEKRIEMGKKSRELSFNYSEDKIMNQWKKLFENLIKK